MDIPGLKPRVLVPHLEMVETPGLEGEEKFWIVAARIRVIDVTNNHVTPA